MRFTSPLRKGLLSARTSDLFDVKAGECQQIRCESCSHRIENSVIAILGFTAACALSAVIYGQDEIEEGVAAVSSQQSEKDNAESESGVMIIAERYTFALKVSLE